MVLNRRVILPRPPHTTVLEVYNLQGGVLWFSHERSGLGMVLSVSINSALGIWNFKGPTFQCWNFTEISEISTSVKGPIREISVKFQILAWTDSNGLSHIWKLAQTGFINAWLSSSLIEILMKCYEISSEMLKFQWNFGAWSGEVKFQIPRLTNTALFAMAAWAQRRGW